MPYPKVKTTEPWAVLVGMPMLSSMGEDFSALAEHADPLVYKRVVASTDAVLAAKGYRREADAPDFHVLAYMSTETKQTYTDWGGSYAFGSGSVASRNIAVDEYEEGTLVIDVVLVESDELMWRGIGRAIVDDYVTPSERSDRIRSAVDSSKGIRKSA